MSEGHNQISSWEKDTGDQLCRREITFIWTIGLGGHQADESIPSLPQYLLLPPFHQTPYFLWALVIDDNGSLESGHLCDLTFSLLTLRQPEAHKAPSFYSSIPWVFREFLDFFGKFIVFRKIPRKRHITVTKIFWRFFVKKYFCQNRLEFFKAALSFVKMGKKACNWLTVMAGSRDCISWGEAKTIKIVEIISYLLAVDILKNSASH